jgi:hypothetical protein
VTHLKIAQSLTMVAGLFTIFTQAPAALTSGPLKVLLQSRPVATTNDFCLSTEVATAFRELRATILAPIDEAAKERKTLEAAMTVLENHYIEISFLMIHSSVEADDLLTFHGRVSWDYIALVQDGNDGAIIIYAYFSILFASVKGDWIIDKVFGENILKYARTVVRPEWQFLLHWAEEQCQNGLQALRGSEIVSADKKHAPSASKTDSAIEEDSPLESLPVD